MNLSGRFRKYGFHAFLEAVEYHTNRLAIFTKVIRKLKQQGFQPTPFSIYRRRCFSPGEGLVKAYINSSAEKKLI